ncbi:MAG: T9SS type A sorting domain-containing protein [Ignavibacteria bacterium]|nr:T9SS type A sorting domain-containing protein [Ignavibacteria bacterium]
MFDNAFVSSVRVGDEVSLTGTVTQFNGLTELENVTLHGIHSSGNNVVPVIVTASQLAGDGIGGVELYEGMLVQVNRVIVRDTLDRPIPTWQVLPAQSGVNYRLKDTSGTVTLRIDRDVDFANTSAPTGEFDIVGIVGQFIPTSPYIGGYQLQPRWRNDIIASGPLMTVQPFETGISENSLTINWQTASPGSSVVRYRNLKTSQDGVVADATLKTLHALKLSDLTPATPYTVQAYSVSGADTSFSANRVVSTASEGSSGAINVYFNKSIDASLAHPDTAKGNTNLADRLLQRINNAQKSIDCALYSISGSVGQQIANALVQAKNRGVSVRVIIEKDNLGAGTGTTFSQIITPAAIPWIDDSFDLVNAGAGLHHNKFFIFDYRGGAPDQAWVWTGSWNLTDPGTADDMQNAIEIQDQALAGAYTHEFNEMWGSENETQNSTTSRFGARKLDNTPHIFNINGTPVELYFSPSDRTTSAIIKTLNTAHHSINAALLTFTRSDIASTLKAKKDTGVRVRALLDNNTDSGSQFGFLTSAGIEVRLDPSAGLLHHKYAVVDAEMGGSSPYLITGSHNWTGAAENSNNENTLIIQSNRIANQYLQEFAARYKEAGGADNIVLSVKEKGEAPEGFGLSQNFPNPFNGMTSVEFRMADFGFVRLKVFDVLGRQVAVLVNEEIAPGIYTVKWDASGLPSGMYLCRLQVREWVETKKVMLVQ